MFNCPLWTWRERLSKKYFLKWWYHHWRKYFTEFLERRLYKWYIIPKIKNFRKNNLFNSSSWTYLRQYYAPKYKIARFFFIFITKSKENSFSFFKYLCFQLPRPPKYFIILCEAHQTFHIPLFLFTKTCQSVVACTIVAMTALPWQWDIIYYVNALIWFTCYLHINYTQGRSFPFFS